MGRKAASFADLLPWGQLCDSGLVSTKQGDLVAGYCFRPPDNDSRTAEEAEVLSDHVSVATTVFGSGWSSWTDVVAFPAGRYPPASARTGVPFKGRR
jgi:type IV secretory pathway VirB4 component